jgi:hypothetical protein
MQDQFGCLEIFEVLIVALYEDLIICTLKVVMLLLHSLHNSQVLPVVNVVASFNTGAFSSVDIDRSGYLETVLLVETATYGDEACIGLQYVQHGRLEMLEDGSISNESFKIPEHQLGIPRPFPFDLFQSPAILCLL